MLGHLIVVLMEITNASFPPLHAPLLHPIPVFDTSRKYFGHFICIRAKPVSAITISGAGGIRKFANKRNSGVAVYSG